LSPLVIALSGAALPVPHAVYSATSVDFGKVAVGTPANSQTVTLSNDGTADLIVNSISTPANTAFKQTNNCTTVKAGSSCSIAVVFTPGAAGAASSVFTVSTNLGIQNVTLSGAGVDVTIGNNGGTGTPTSTVKAGTAAQYSLSLAPQGGFTGTVTFACSNLPVHASCTLNPPSADLSSATNVAVTINTQQTQTARLEQRPSVFYAALPILGLFGMLPVIAANKKLRNKACLRTLMLLLAITAVGLPITACGGGGGGGTTTTPPPQPQIVTTPPGTYTVTFTATGGGVSHSTNLNLVVQ
jgi:hypothetical protein